MAQITDYRAMFDSEYLYAWDLQGHEVTVTIEKVVAGTLTGQGGRKTKKPLVFFKGKEKALGLNKTNGKIICGMYGADTKNWIGKQVTLYPTKTEMAGETVDCIRIKPGVPTGKPEEE
jgi:hypothetical protein